MKKSKNEANFNVIYVSVNVIDIKGYTVQIKGPSLQSLIASLLRSRPIFYFIQSVGTELPKAST